MSTDTVTSVDDGDPWRPSDEVPETYREQLVAELRARIADGRLHGRLLPEPDMAVHYGVSRWTLRDALGVLKSEDPPLLVARPRRGTFVIRAEDRGGTKS